MSHYIGYLISAVITPHLNNAAAIGKQTPHKTLKNNQ